MNYRIVSHTFYAPDGSTFPIFYIQQKKKFLFWSYWNTIESEEGTLSFRSYDEADNCIYHLQSSSYTV